MSVDTHHIREQTLANARLLLRPINRATSQPTSSSSGNTSQSTLVSSPSAPSVGDLDLVVFGSGSFTAAVMVGLTPAIEGDTAPTPEGAVRKLFIATCELLKMYIPKVGSHQRNIHGGGVFDEDMISASLLEAQKKAP